MVVAASCCRDAAWTGRLVRIEEKMNDAKYREILEHSGPQTGAKAHRSDFGTNL
jgi:hypothetical protein